MDFGATNFNGIFPPISPKWGIPNPGGTTDNGAAMQFRPILKSTGFVATSI
jgi:hypothetical protein